ncbi:MAG: SMP-30/gluconolactonase/LRE family protein [Gemmataceae bacterium]
MRRLIGMVLLVPLALVPAADVAPPRGEVIVAPGAKLELLYTRAESGKGGLTEGPAAAPDGSIYFSDITEGTEPGKILRFDPKSGTTTVFAADSRKSNGMEFDRRGRLIACEGADHGGRAVVAWDVRTGKRTVLADRYRGKRFNAPNDLTIDAKDRIYFSDPRYLGNEPRELEHRAVYRLDPDGTVIEITHDVEKPNGLALSPDGRTLYVADHNNGTDRIDPSKPAPKPGAMKVYAFPLNADGRVAGPRRTLVDFGPGPGCDGMCVDAAGRLYLTVRETAAPRVQVVDPASGRTVGIIHTGPLHPGTKAPVGLPSNVTFGRGTDRRTLYVTVDTSLYRLRMAVDGFHVADAK